MGPVVKLHQVKRLLFCTNGNYRAATAKRENENNGRRAGDTEEPLLRRRRLVWVECMSIVRRQIKEFILPVLDIILSGDADLGTKRWLYRFDYCLVSGL